MAFVMNDRDRRFTLAAVSGAAQRLTAILSTVILFPRVLQAIGTDNFGLWGAATSLSLLFVVADFGVGPAILSLVSRALTSPDADLPRRQFTAGLFMACIAAIIVAIAGTITTLAVVPASEAPAFLIAITGIAITVPFGAASSAWLSLQRGWMVAVCELSQTVMVFGGLILASIITRNVYIYILIVYVTYFVANAGNLIILFCRHPELRPQSLPSYADMRLVVHTGFRFFVLSILDAPSYMLDNVFALQLLGIVASARMAVVQRVSVAAIGLLMVATQPLWPAFVEAAAKGEKQWIVRTLLRGSALVIGLSIAGSALIGFFGRPILRVWLKSDIGFEQSLLWAIGAWIVAMSLARVQMLLLNALRIIDFQLILVLIATTISVGLKFVLAPRYGVSGILISSAITVPLIILPGTVWRIAQWHKTA
jgi:O-antigen/teichoic acid export membrane protein